ncbi:MAG: methyltransferase domain-containing protein [Sediminibacterium sp.]
MENSLHEYYSNLKIQPTHASFASSEELEKYNKVRKSVFLKLNLPYTYFKGKEGLELGPDTGENSLIFGSWDVKLTLSEPNTLAHPMISDYFKKFKLTDNLVEVKNLSVEQFTDTKQYDFIDAEGFIYTVKPHESWIKSLKNYIKSDGFFILSYYEFYGSFFELFLKAIYSRAVQGNKYADELATAELLFQTKWDTIPHTRKFKSWYYDVIKNPYVRKEYIINNDEFLTSAYENKYRLYSSYPSLKKGTDLSWIKAEVTTKGEYTDIIATYNERKLGYFLGMHINNVPDSVNSLLYELISITDAMIDQYTPEACKRAEEILVLLTESLETARPANKPAQIDSALHTLEMYRSIFKSIAAGPEEQLINDCCNNKIFLETWGSPVFYVVLSA